MATITDLKSNDYVGISFWLISLALTASTAFFILEQRNIRQKWQLPLNVSALVTGIAAIHYFSMRYIWVKNKKSPTVYRYIDWFLTVPLQIVEFYLILSVSGDITIDLFYKLLGASIAMILFGFLGETNAIDRNLGFILGTLCWLYILYEIFYGEAAKIKDKIKDEAIKNAFDNLRWIVTIGWSIYPIGYLLGETNMNLVYNLADLINKILFGLIIWYSAKYLDVKKS